MSAPDIAAAIAAHAAAQPDTPALVWQDHEITYGELCDRAVRAQAALDALDLASGERVGLIAPRSPDAVATVLACLLADRPFVLPSPALPPPALDELFARAGCRHVLSVEDAPVTGTGGGMRPGPAVAVPASDTTPVFHLTTSGSTGPPKIVPLPRGAVNRFAAWAADHFDIAPGRTVLNHAPLNFDLCLLDVWTTLAQGGRVVLVDPQRAADGRHLVDLITRHEVDVVQGVPLLYSLLLDGARAEGITLDAVSEVISTGDILPPRVLAGLAGLFPRARLVNVYGCTETNDSFLQEIDETHDPGEPVPLGAPLTGVDALVIDPDGGLLDGPGSGELYVSTPFQSPGYLGMPSERFTTHPLGADGKAWFRTGDLVRRDAAGRLFVEGRIDFQVKVRGVCVNLAEVERVLLDHPDVRGAAVTADTDEATGRRLTGTVQRAPASRLNSLALRRHCAERLPPAAIPTALHITDDPLPRTATGKVDRRAVAVLTRPDGAVPIPSRPAPQEGD